MQQNLSVLWNIKEEESQSGKTQTVKDKKPLFKRQSRRTQLTKNIC